MIAGMSKLAPKSRPQATHSAILQHLEKAGLDIRKEKVVIVGVRGYYKRTMGDPFKNDRNLYDDAIFIVTEQSLAAFNANADPSVFRKGIATLQPGVYDVVKWKHRGKYAALQIVKDVLKRDGQPGTSTGRRGINFHYGGNMSTTGSEGCQTFPPAQYWQFQGLVYELMDTHKKTSVKYVLVEE